MNIREEEVLRYLGYNQHILDKSLKQLIKKGIEEIQGMAQVRGIYKTYDIKHLEKGGLSLSKNLILKGQSIADHLEGCSKCTLLGVTLGPEVDKKIRVSQLTDMAYALILDACASEAIESVCNTIQAEIKKKAQSKGYYITSRFSPGYGDLSIDIQSQIIKHLNGPQSIGLTVSEDHLMIPRKSVTAFIGWSPTYIKERPRNCTKCRLHQHCSYRKEGKDCGH